MAETAVAGREAAGCGLVTQTLAAAAGTELPGRGETKAEPSRGDGRSGKQQ